MTALVTVIGFAVGGELNANQKNVLGNFFMLIGQVLETEAAQQQSMQSSVPDGLAARVEALEKRLDELMAPGKSV